MFVVLEIRLRGAIFLHILEIKKQYFISFKKHIPNPVMSYFGKRNGKLQNNSPTLQITDFINKIKYKCKIEKIN